MLDEKAYMGEESIAVGTSPQPDVRASATWNPLEAASRVRRIHCVPSRVGSRTPVEMSASGSARKMVWTTEEQTSQWRRRGPSKCPSWPETKPVSRYEASEAPVLASWIEVSEDAARVRSITFPGAEGLVRLGRVGPKASAPVWFEA